MVCNSCSPAADGTSPISAKQVGKSYIRLFKTQGVCTNWEAQSSGKPHFTELLQILFTAWTLGLAKKLSNVRTIIASCKFGIPLALVVHMPFPWTRLMCSAHALVTSHTKRPSASVPSIETCIRYCLLSATRHQLQLTPAYPGQAKAFWSPGIGEVLKCIVKRLEHEERSLYSPAL